MSAGLARKVKKSTPSPSVARPTSNPHSPCNPLRNSIDALAASGMTLKDMHTFPLCTPSRAQLLTGRLAPRTGVTTNFAPESLHGLATEELTIAQLLKPAGYDTVQLGKW